MYAFGRCKRCNGPGYYLQMYSKEGYCAICEIKYFPERYFPCVCCRLPLFMRGFCSTCSTGVSEHLRGSYAWMKRHESKEHGQKDFIHSWEQSTICSNGDVLPPGFKLDHVMKQLSVPRFPQFWPGFYMGNGVWEKLNYLPELDVNGIVIPRT